jgi:hypothetical protein
METTPKIKAQMSKAGLPQGGSFPFRPELRMNASGKVIIDTADVKLGPKRGKRGRVDEQARIWIRDQAHAGLPDHWDVQIDGGSSHIRVDMNGNVLP